MEMRNLRILVVDDDPSVRTATCHMLEFLHHEAVPAKGGAAAIQLLEKERFDLAVVDTRMPGINGDQVRRFIKQRFPGMKLITASGMPSREVQSDVEAGRHVYLQKPFHMHQLRNAIDSLMPRQEPPALPSR